MTALYARIIMYAALVLAIFTGGIALEHRLAAVRLQAVELKYSTELNQAQAKAAAETAELAAKASVAEINYEHEHDSLIDYVNANPVGVVRLCNNPPAASVPKGTAAKSGTASAAPSPGAVQPVPSGDSGVRPVPGPDIGQLLNVLADRADEISAKARESQQKVK